MANILEPEQLHMDFGLDVLDYDLFYPFPSTRFLKI